MSLCGHAGIPPQLDVAACLEHERPVAAGPDLVEVWLACDLCSRLREARAAMAKFRAWDAQVVSHMFRVFATFESLREPLAEENAVQLELVLLFEKWLHGDWGGRRWSHMVSRVDPPTRRQATFLYAWWTVRKAWHNPKCKHDDYAEFQSQCLLRHLHEAMEGAKASYDWALAEHVFNFIMKLSDPPPVAWQHLHQTPEYHVPVSYLRTSRPVWRREESNVVDRLARILEGNAEAILREWSALRELAWTHSDEHLAYDGYVTFITNTSKADWFRWRFFTTASGWNNTLCAPMPTLCGVLRGELPGARMGVGSAYEEVVISQLPPGAHVGIHSGQPQRLNLHMGLTGLTPSSYIGILSKGAQTTMIQWEAGKVTAIFDDSYDHYVQVDRELMEPRVVLHVGICHPDVCEENVF